MLISALVTGLAVSLTGQPTPTTPPTTTTSGAPQPGPAKAVAPAAGPYRVLKTIDAGGEGGWDALTVDPDARRLYISRGTHVMVLDADTGAGVGDIPDTAGVHGIAVAPALNKGFTSNGRADTVTVFDLKTLMATGTVATGKNPDAILFEPVTKRVFVFNGRSNDATVINAADNSVAGTIALGGKPEFGAFDGAGKVFVNIEDTGELVRLDAATMKVEQRTSLAPGAEPSGLAIDPVHHRLFCACGNEHLIVVDGVSGKVLADLPIGKGVDGCEFDAASGCALTSNGEGTMSVISTAGDTFAVVQTLKTAPRARTMTIDPKTHRVFLPTAEFEAAPEPAKDAPKDAKGGARPRPTMKPGSFKVVVVGP